MLADPVVFRDLAYVFVAAVVGGALAWRARQPLVLGYVLGGLLISPFTPGPAVSDVRTFEVFAEIGVVLLMFSIGIEFSLKDLLRVKWVALVGGPLGIALCIGLGLGVGAMLGWPPRQGMAVGVVVSIASTMVLARLLLDRGELHSRHGRLLIGTALVEDLAVVVLIVLMPALAALESSRLVAVGVALVKAGVILVPFLYLAVKITPHLLTRVARTQDQELFLLVALAVALGAAALTQALGLSLALGAFLAGLIISESDYAHETLARLLPLRDAFVALFFVTIGALIDPRALAAHLPLLCVMVALILVGKFVIRSAIVRVFGYPWSTAVLVGVGLTQIGEFSFVLVKVARGAGHVGHDVYNTTLAASLLTILVNAALVRAVNAWIGRVRLAPSRAPAPSVSGAGDRLRNHVVLAGFGRVGSAIGEALETFGLTHVVIESDPDVVKDLRARGIPCLFGDAAQRRHLEAAGVARAALVIVAIPDDQRVRLAVRTARSLNPAVPILARVHHREASDGLRGAGATEVIQPELEAGLTAIRHALGRLGLPKESLLAYLERLRDAIGGAGERARDAGRGLPEVREVTVGPQDEFADQSLREARLPERFGVTVVAIRRAEGEPSCRR
ncbi:MAG: cation:proton antiporter [Candidatus Rokubacteria bacterium]|nr:cation:proton antiporter [Candidatus Rokubacteria bacterium]